MTGCVKQEDDYEETTVTVSNKGVITHKIIESFEKSYYDENELKELIDNDLKQYCENKNDEKSCKLISLNIREQ
ncbi:MAG: hypothetical protein K6E98_04875, partial [Lachnospiraceae bacterium]|nr:hypothetical protein [Lachnospiraceae bacterium]